MYQGLHRSLTLGKGLWTKRQRITETVCGSALFRLRCVYYDQDEGEIYLNSNEDFFRLTQILNLN